MDWIADPQIWIALVTLTVLEIVLGIDNIIFIAILAGKLPEHQREKARKLGLGLALITRILLLCLLVWMVHLTAPLFSLFGHAFSGRDLILLAGGIFLLTKSTREIHEKLEGDDGAVTARLTPTFASVIIQILLLDMVFSLDSVVTAIGLAQHLPVMITAVIVAVVFMLFFSRFISDFVHRHPTLKMLALSFLLLIGVLLVAEGFGQHIPRGYVYFAMAFSAGVECLNLRAQSQRKTKVIELKQAYR